MTTTDRYERIRKALEMGATPGPWRVLGITSMGSGRGYYYVTTTDDTVICDLRDRPLGDAHLIAACDPDTIRALLDERDELRGEADSQAERDRILGARVREIARQHDARLDPYGFARAVMRAMEDSDG